MYNYDISTLWFQFALNILQWEKEFPIYSNPLVNSYHPAGSIFMQ